MASLIADEGDDSFVRDLGLLAESELEERGSPSREMQALADFLGARLAEAESTTFQPRDLATFLKQVLDDPEFSDVRAGNLLKRCGFARAPGRKHGSTYTVTRATATDWAHESGVELRDPVWGGQIDREVLAQMARYLEGLTEAQLEAQAIEEYEAAHRRGERWQW